VRDVMSEIGRVVANGDRALVTTLTKRLAEELTDYLSQNDIRAATCTLRSSPWRGRRSFAS